MATPKDGLTVDMLKSMTRLLDDVPPLQDLFVTKGWRDKIAAEYPMFAVREQAPTNPLMSGYTTSYMGVAVDVVDIPPEEIIDWSGCRSPSRARRRHAAGIPQRIKITYRDRAYLVDRKALADMMALRFEQSALRALRGA